MSRTINFDIPQTQGGRRAATVSISDSAQPEQYTSATLAVVTALPTSAELGQMVLLAQSDGFIVGKFAWTGTEWEAIGLLRRRVTLANAAIKGLPLAAYPIVPAPDANVLAVINNGVLICDASAGAYTGLAEDDYAVFSYGAPVPGSENNASVYIPKRGSAPSPLNTLLGVAAVNAVTCPAPYMGQVATWNMIPIPVSPGGLGLGISLSMWTADGIALGGGHADNVLVALVEYSLLKTGMSL